MLTDDDGNRTTPGVHAPLTPALTDYSIRVEDTVLLGTIIPLDSFISKFRFR